MTDPKEAAVPPGTSWMLDSGDDAFAETAKPQAAEREPHQTEMPAVDVPESSAPPPLARIIEAMLFVGGTPLTAERACSAIHGLTPEQFREQIDELGGSYRRQGRPYQIRLQDQGFVLTLKPRFRGLEDRLHGSDREARLSQAAVDALALVAYRQPATKQEIDAIRGADSGSLLRQLLRRGLIAVQRGQAEQREIAYCTTRRFLELFGLKSLDDLPQTQDLQKI
jgi:segregation and condensation protein B